MCLLTCQLAFEIDREADDQNDYLDNMVRNLFCSQPSGVPPPPLTLSSPPLLLLLLLLGFQLPECHRPAKRQRQAFLHHGPVWPRQPPHSVLRVGGRGPGLLPALLHGVQDPELIGDRWGCGPLLHKKTLVYSKQTESRGLWLPTVWE